MASDEKSDKNQPPPKPKPPLPTEDPSLILQTSSNRPLPSARPAVFFLFPCLVILISLLVALYFLLQYLK